MAGKARTLRLGKIGFCKADGTVVPWDSLTPDEVERIHVGWQKKLSETMSAYYTEHPEEFAVLQSLPEPETKASVPGGHPTRTKTHKTCKQVTIIIAHRRPNCKPKRRTKKHESDHL